MLGLGFWRRGRELTHRGSPATIAIQRGRSYRHKAVPECQPDPMDQRSRSPLSQRLAEMTTFHQTPVSADKAFDAQPSFFTVRVNRLHANENKIAGWTTRETGRYSGLPEFLRPMGRRGKTSELRSSPQPTGITPPSGSSLKGPGTTGCVPLRAGGGV